MRIKGTIEVNGAQFTINLEVADDTTEFYLTNLPPNYLAIPKEQMLIDHLRLGEKAVRRLKKAGIHNLDQLLENGWKLKTSLKLSEDLRWQVESAIDDLRKSAVIFDPLEESVIVEADGWQECLPEESPSEEIKEIIRQVIPPVRPESVCPTDPISRLGLDKRITSALTRRHGRKFSVRELAQTSKTRLIMVQGITSSDIVMIESRLQHFGFKLGEKKNSTIGDEGRAGEQSDKVVEQVTDFLEESL